MRPFKKLFINLFLYGLLALFFFYLLNFDKSSNILSIRNLNIIIPGLLVYIALNFYRDYISGLREKVSNETFKKKRRKAIFLMSLVTWVIISTLLLIKDYVLFSDERWFKTVFIGLMSSIFVIFIPVAFEEYNYYKNQKKDILK